MFAVAEKTSTRYQQKMVDIVIVKVKVKISLLQAVETHRVARG
jgi:hypothetical protein